MTILMLARSIHQQIVDTLKTARQLLTTTRSLAPVKLQILVGERHGTGTRLDRESRTGLDRHNTQQRFTFRIRPAGAKGLQPRQQLADVLLHLLAMA